MEKLYNRDKKKVIPNLCIKDIRTSKGNSRFNRKYL